jgi:23S rRNA pseudouridine1911/1915/1917 synthase
MAADSTIPAAPIGARDRLAPLAILHRDEHLLVVDKPAGLLSVGGPRSVADALAEQGLAARPVHRLDREVSGALLCAASDASRAALEDLFRGQRIAKTYWGLVRGRPPAREGELAYPILEERERARVSARGKPARTRYRTLRELRLATELEIELVTGRRNQIRVHLAHAGAPLVGETKYARRGDDPLRAKRVALHAWRLAFEHPFTGRALAVEAPLPAELAALAERAA